jgi:hypothetical protein
MHPFASFKYSIAVWQTSYFANDAIENTLFTFNYSFYSFADVIIRRNGEVWEVTESIDWKLNAISIPGNCDFVRAFTDDRNSDLIN